MRNDVFLKLVDAVFDMGSSLLDYYQRGFPRPHSNHCATNRNTEFFPHVNISQNMGQSLSNIVGVGSYYKGGELFVEEDSGGNSEGGSSA